MTELTQFWLSNLLNLKINYTDLRKNPECVIKIIIQILNKYQLIDARQIKIVENALCFEDKFHILSTYLKPLKIEINDGFIAQIKYGNQEKVSSIFNKLYMALAKNCNYKYGSLQKYHEKVEASPNTRFSKFTVTLPVSETEKYKRLEEELNFEGQLLHQLQDFSKIKQKIMHDELADSYGISNTSINQTSCDVKQTPFILTKKKLHQDIMEFDSRFTEPQYNFDDLLRLQDVGCSMQAETWDACKYNTLKKSVLLQRRIRDQVVCETKSRILNCVYDAIEKKCYNKKREDKISYSISSETLTEKKFKGKLQACKNLIKMETKHNEKMEKESEVRKTQANERRVKAKVEREFQKQRKTLEDKYNQQKQSYDQYKRQEAQEDTQLLDDILNTCIALTVKYHDYRKIHNNILPEIIWAEWRALLLHGSNTYDLPEYQSYDTLFSPHLIKLDYTDEAIVAKMHSMEYINCKGNWNRNTIERLSPITSDQIVDALKAFCLSQEKVPVCIDTQKLKVRAILQTNFEKRDDLYTMICCSLKPLKIEVIELESLYQKLLEQYNEAFCHNEDDDGFCELVTESPIPSNSSFKDNSQRSKSRLRSVLKSSQNDETMSTISKVTRKPSRTKSVIISTTILPEPSKPKATHKTQTPKSWESKPTSHLIKLMEEIIPKIDHCNTSVYDLDSDLKVQLVTRYIQELTDSNGFVLLDFPSTIDEYEQMEKLLTGQHPQMVNFNFYQSEYVNPCSSDFSPTFFTHHLRLKNFSRLNKDLYFDEIHKENFQTIYDFYTKFGVYHTIEHYGLNKNLINDIVNELNFTSMVQSDTYSYKSCYKPRTFMRTPKTLKYSEVEIQIDMNNHNDEDQIENDSEIIVDSFIDKWTKNLSKFYADEQVFKWNSLKSIYKNNINHVLYKKSNLARDIIAFKHFLESVINFVPKKSIQDREALLKFEQKFIEIDIFYRRDEDGIAYLYSLVEDLSKNIYDLIDEKSQWAKSILSYFLQDTTILDMANFILHFSKWLLFYEISRFINSIRFLIELFSFLLHEEIVVKLPDVSPPETTNIAPKVQTLFNSLSTQLSNHSLSLITLARNPSEASLLSLPLSFEVQTTIISNRISECLDLDNELNYQIEIYETMIQELVSQLNEAIDRDSVKITQVEENPGFSKEKRNNKSDTASVTSTVSKRPRRSIRRKSSLKTIFSVESEKPSTIIPDPIDERKTLLKDKLKHCIAEHVSLVNASFIKISSRTNKDLTDVIINTTNSLMNFRNIINCRDDIEKKNVNGLVRSLANAIESNWIAVKIRKEKGTYMVEGTPFMSPQPSLESMNIDTKLLKRLPDIKYIVKTFQSTFSHSCYLSYHQIMDIIIASVNNLRLGYTILFDTIAKINHFMNQLTTSTDNVYLIDWRDIILNMIDIQLPTLCELEIMKERFESKSAVKNLKYISLKSCMCIKLWFESQGYSDECVKEMKTILFDMYKKSDTSVDYERLLIGLCKDEDPFYGFTKAMCLFKGTFYNNSFELGEEYLKTLKEISDWKLFVNDEINNLTRNIICKIINSSSFIPKQSHHDLIENYNQAFPSTENRLPNQLVTLDTVSHDIEHSKDFTEKRKTRGTILYKTHEEISLPVHISNESMQDMCDHNLQSLCDEDSLVSIYLKTHKLHSCGCPIHIPDCKALHRIMCHPFTDREFWIDSPDLIKAIFKNVFPHIKPFGQKYDLVTGIQGIFDTLLNEHKANSEGNGYQVAVHKLLHHDFVKHWIQNGLNFKNTQLCLPNDNDNSED